MTHAGALTNRARVVAGEAPTISAAGMRRQIVLVGAGHAHVEVLRQFGLRPAKSLRLTLVSNSAHAVYSGMLPGYVAGHYSAEEIRIDIEKVARFADCNFVIGEAKALDPVRRAIRLEDGREFGGDILSLDVGGATNIISDVWRLDPVLPVKPIEEFTRRWSQIWPRLRTELYADIAVIGAGAAGVELALCLQYRLAREWRVPRPRQAPIVTLIVDQAGLVPTFPTSVRERLARLLSDHGAGDRYAVASRGRWSAEGRWVWWWKRWIDRRFIRRYANLPERSREVIV